MSFIARKISRAKWPQNQEQINISSISADAVTADLRTSKNSLSFWKCNDASEENLEKTVLALASGANRIDMIDVVWLLQDDLVAENFSFEETEGLTPVNSLKKYHIDIVNLNLASLEKLAKFIANSVNNHKYKRFSLLKVKQIIQNALDKNLLSLSDLHEKVQEELMKKDKK